MTDPTPIRDIVAVLRMADAGRYTDGFSTHALAAAAWNRYIDSYGGLTGAGRKFLTEYGWTNPEEQR
jgi:hypothetical protein